MFKYPRTPHIQGSRLQPGDEDLDQVPFARLAGRRLVLEEKVDGANAGVWFDEAGRLQLQNRGHVLTGGARERQFNLFKAWGARHHDQLFGVLDSRYVLYGEWLYAKHKVFYDLLPHYFLAFDVLDTTDRAFLARERRLELLHGLPVASVPALSEGPVLGLKQLQAFVRPSYFKGPGWRERLHEAGVAAGVDADLAVQETDASDLMEGLYVKVEEDGRVVERYKFVRQSYVSGVLDWGKQPLVPNQLRPGVDLFAGSVAHARA